jgi:hypothetical protein
MSVSSEGRYQSLSVALARSCTWTSAFGSPLVLPCGCFTLRRKSAEGDYKYDVDLLTPKELPWCSYQRPSKSKVLDGLFYRTPTKTGCHGTPGYVVASAQISQIATVGSSQGRLRIICFEFESHFLMLLLLNPPHHVSYISCSVL